MKARVIRMADAVNYICEYLSNKDISMTEIADVTDKLISFEIEDKLIDEDKLDELANKEYPDFIYRDLNMSNKSHRDAYKAGYHKAKEE